MPADPSDLSSWSRARYFVGNLFLSGVLGAARLVPYRWRIPMMGRLVSLVSPLVGFSKRVRDNLTLVCPDLPDQEIKQLCRAVPDNVGRAIMEQFSPDEFIERQKTAQISGPGSKAYDDAVAQGRPIMMITAHFGNYLAARVALQHHGGKPIGGLYRRMANPYFNETYVEGFKRTGEPMFEQGRRGMMEMVRWLKQGGTIAILQDLHVHGGEELSFFGKPAVTSVLNAELALKYDAVMIPCYAIRQTNGLDFQVVLQDPVPHSDPKTMTQYLNDDLEAIVRQHMGQWFWIHRRWKPWYDLGVQPEDIP